MFGDPTYTSLCRQLVPTGVITPILGKGILTLREPLTPLFLRTQQKRLEIESMSLDSGL